MLLPFTEYPELAELAPDWVRPLEQRIRERPVHHGRCDGRRYIARPKRAADDRRHRERIEEHRVHTGESHAQRIVTPARPPPALARARFEPGGRALDLDLRAAFRARNLGGERHARDVRLGLEPSNDLVAQLRGARRVSRVLLARPASFCSRFTESSALRYSSAGNPGPSSSPRAISTP